MNFDKLPIIRAILSKTTPTSGCTPGEKSAALEKAVELVKKYSIPHSSVASLWPKGYDFDGNVVATPVQPKADIHKATNDFIRNAFAQGADEFLRQAMRDADLRKAKAAREATAKKAMGKAGSIGAMARELLIHPAGHSYSWIIEMIQFRFPDAKTTVASLRWYENELRNKGFTVPKRKA